MILWKRNVKITLFQNESTAYAGRWRRDLSQKQQKYENIGHLSRNIVVYIFPDKYFWKYDWKLNYYSFCEENPRTIII